MASKIVSVKDPGPYGSQNQLTQFLSTRTSLQHKFFYDTPSIMHTLIYNLVYKHTHLYNQYHNKHNPVMNSFIKLLARRYND